MEVAELIERYAEGPQLLRKAVAGMTDEQLDAKPVSGTWSTRQVICHIADFEPVYADRMKRVIAENEPTFFGGDPDVFAAGLAYEQRDVAEELAVVESVRRSMTRIFRSLPAEAFQRRGIHASDGPLPLVVLLERITNHIPHHVKFVDAKREALGL